MTIFDPAAAGVRSSRSGSLSRSRSAALAAGRRSALSWSQTSCRAGDAPWRRGIGRQFTGLHGGLRIPTITESKAGTMCASSSGAPTSAAVVVPRLRSSGRRGADVRRAVARRRQDGAFVGRCQAALQARGGPRSARKLSSTRTVNCVPRSGRRSNMRRRQPPGASAADVKHFKESGTHRAKCRPTSVRIPSNSAQPRRRFSR